MRREIWLFAFFCLLLEGDALGSGRPDKHGAILGPQGLLETLDIQIPKLELVKQDFDEEENVAPECWQSSFRRFFYDIRKKLDEAREEADAKELKDLTRILDAAVSAAGDPSSSAGLYGALNACAKAAVDFDKKFRAVRDPAGVDKPSELESAYRNLEAKGEEDDADLLEGIREAIKAKDALDAARSEAAGGFSFLLGSWMEQLGEIQSQVKQLKAPTPVSMKTEQEQTQDLKKAIEGMPPERRKRVEAYLKEFLEISGKKNPSKKDIQRADSLTKAMFGELKQQYQFDNTLTAKLESLEGQYRRVSAAGEQGKKLLYQANIPIQDQKSGRTAQKREDPLHERAKILTAVVGELCGYVPSIDDGVASRCKNWADSKLNQYEINLSLKNQTEAAVRMLAGRNDDRAIGFIKQLQEADQEGDSFKRQQKLRESLSNIEKAYLTGDAGGTQIERLDRYKKAKTRLDGEVPAYMNSIALIKNLKQEKGKLEKQLQSASDEEKRKLEIRLKQIDGALEMENKKAKKHYEVLTNLKKEKESLHSEINAENERLAQAEQQGKLTSEDEAALLRSGFYDERQKYRGLLEEGVVLGSLDSRSTYTADELGLQDIEVLDLSKEKPEFISLLPDAAKDAKVRIKGKNFEIGPYEGEGGSRVTEQRGLDGGLVFRKEIAENANGEEISTQHYYEGGRLVRVIKSQIQTDKISGGGFEDTVRETVIPGSELIMEGQFDSAGELVRGAILTSGKIIEMDTYQAPDGSWRRKGVEKERNGSGKTLAEQEAVLEEITDPKEIEAALRDGSVIQMGGKIYRSQLVKKTEMDASGKISRIQLGAGYLPRDGRKSGDGFDDALSLVKVVDFEKIGFTHTPAGNVDMWNWFQRWSVDPGFPKDAELTIDAQNKTISYYDSVKKAWFEAKWIEDGPNGRLLEVGEYKLRPGQNPKEKDAFQLAQRWLYHGDQGFSDRKVFIRTKDAYGKEGFAHWDEEVNDKAFGGVGRFTRAEGAYGGTKYPKEFSFVLPDFNSILQLNPDLSRNEGVAGFAHLVKQGPAYENIAGAMDRTFGTLGRTLRWAGGTVTYLIAAGGDGYSSHYIAIDSSIEIMKSSIRNAESALSSDETRKHGNYTWLTDQDILRKGLKQVPHESAKKYVEDKRSDWAKHEAKAVEGEYLKNLNGLVRQDKNGKYLPLIQGDRGTMELIKEMEAKRDQRMAQIMVMNYDQLVGDGSKRNPGSKEFAAWLVDKGAGVAGGIQTVKEHYGEKAGSALELTIEVGEMAWGGQLGGSILKQVGRFGKGGQSLQTTSRFDRLAQFREAAAVRGNNLWTNALNEIKTVGVGNMAVSAAGAGMEAHMLADTVLAAAEGDPIHMAKATALYAGFKAAHGVRLGGRGPRETINGNVEAARAEIARIEQSGRKPTPQEIARIESHLAEAGKAYGEMMNEPSGYQRGDYARNQGFRELQGKMEQLKAEKVLDPAARQQRYNELAREAGGNVPKDVEGLMKDYQQSAKSGNAKRAKALKEILEMGEARAQMGPDAIIHPEPTKFEMKGDGTVELRGDAETKITDAKMQKLKADLEWAQDLLKEAKLDPKGTPENIQKREAKVAQLKEELAKSESEPLKTMKEEAPPQQQRLPPEPVKMPEPVKSKGEWIDKAEIAKINDLPAEFKSDWASPDGVTLLKKRYYEGEMKPGQEKMAYRGMGLDDVAMNKILSDVQAGRGVQPKETYSVQKLCDYAVEGAASKGSGRLKGLFKNKTPEIDAEIGKFTEYGAPKSQKDAALGRLKELLREEVNQRAPSDPSVEVNLVKAASEYYLNGNFPGYLQSAGLAGAKGDGAGLALSFAIEKGMAAGKNSVVFEIDPAKAKGYDLYKDHPNAYANNAQEIVFIGEIPSNAIKSIWINGKNYPNPHYRP